MNEHYPIAAVTWEQSERIPFTAGATAMASEIQDAEEDAILAGILAGEFVLEQSRRSGVLKLFAKDEHAARINSKLDALRVYAEFRRVLMGKDRHVPTASLLASGYTDAQIMKFDASIVAWPNAR